MFHQEVTIAEVLKRQDLIDELYKMRKLILAGFDDIHFEENMKTLLSHESFTAIKTFSDDFQHQCLSRQQAQMQTICQMIEDVKILDCHISLNKADLYQTLMKQFLQAEIGSFEYQENYLVLQDLFKTLPDIEDFLQENIKRLRKPFEELCLQESSYGDVASSTVKFQGV